MPVTCVAVTSEGGTAYTGSKDCCLIQWDIEHGGKSIWKGRRLEGFEGGHCHEVLSVAVSSDGKYVASGGRDGLVRLWDPRSQQLIDSFKGHRDIITSVRFAKDSAHLFTGSADRTIKSWNITDMAYIESLFGHQSGVTDIACIGSDFAVSSSSDRSLRFWKVDQSSQLVFNGPKANTDAVAMLTSQYFAAGASDGCISLWSTQKKKALHSVEQAHGEGHWISSLESIPQSDLLFSGSHDGQLRLWDCSLQSNGRGTMSAAGAIPVTGFVNGISVSANGRVLVAGVGQEHRLGRWFRVKEAKNGLFVLPLPFDFSTLD